MIGQTKLNNKIIELMDNNKFPRFSIFVGPKGSGKKTFINNIIVPLFYDIQYRPYKVQDVKVDSMREVVKSAYKQSNLVYIIADADSMSVSAKNSLLKVVEECPNNNYFIMTLEDKNNTLDTIRSRATIFDMDIYSPDDIVEYAHTVWKNENSKDAEKIIKDVCKTPGEVNALIDYGVVEFYQYVEKVVDKIAEVSGANAFKIANKVALKKDDDGYNLELFWKTFLTICSSRLSQNNEKYSNGISATSYFLSTLMKIKTANRQVLLDTWVLEIRELWM